MKPLCLILLLAMSLSGCSRFSKEARVERAYYKSLEKAKVAREKSLKTMARQRSEMRSLRETPPPLQQQTVQASPEGL
jgi:cytochrome c biogenesis protein ResB